MSTTQTIEQLRHLKLKAMANTYTGVLEQALHLQPEAHDLIALLSDAETTSRINNKTERLRKRSKLRYRAYLGSAHKLEVHFWSAKIAEE